MRVEIKVTSMSFSHLENPLFNFFLVSVSFLKGPRSGSEHKRDLEDIFYLCSSRLTKDVRELTKMTCRAVGMCREK